MKRSLVRLLATLTGLLVLAACGPAPLQNPWRDCPADHSVFWAAAGDADGDGVQDLLVGACCGGGAELFKGLPGGLSPAPVWRYNGGSPSALTGLCVGFAGALAGGGVQVLFVASPRDQEVGTVSLFRCGKDGPEAKPWKVLRSPTKGEGYGEQVIGAGDLNGDGYADLAVADFGYDHARGKVYVYYGGPQGPARVPDWSAEGEAPGDWFGYSMGAADMDGDGITDLILSAKNCTGACATWLAGDPRFELHRKYLLGRADADLQNTSQTGKLYIYYGRKEGLAAKPGLVQEGLEPHASFAFRVLPVGDVNGDGRADLVVSSPGWQARRGKVELFAGGPPGVQLRKLWSVEGSAQEQELGYILGLGPDFDGSGRPSLLAGSVRADLINIYAGKPGGFETSLSRQLTGPQAGGRWGALAGMLAPAGAGSGPSIYALVDSPPAAGSPKPRGCVAVFSAKP